MSLPVDLSAALRRLSNALGGLEVAVDQRVAADAAHSDRDEEFAIMQDDRSRLAVEMDGALARARGLEAAHREALRRLDRADAVVRGLIGEAVSPGQPPDTAEP